MELDPNRLRTLIEQLGLALQSLSAAVRRVPVDWSAEKASCGVDAGALANDPRQQRADWLDRLESLLSNDDTESNRLFEDARPLLREVFGERLHRLERHIGDFEYEQALALLRELRAEQPADADQ